MANFKNAQEMTVDDLDIRDGYIILGMCETMEAAKSKEHWLEKLPHLKGIKENPDFYNDNGVCRRREEYI